MHRDRSRQPGSVFSLEWHHDANAWQTVFAFSRLDTTQNHFCPATLVRLFLAGDLPPPLTIEVIRKHASFCRCCAAQDRCHLTFITKCVFHVTTDRAGLKKGVSDIEKPRGGTNLWDALRFVFEKVLVQSRNENRRSAVVLMTDGIDNALPDVAGEGSATSFDELMKIVAASDSIVLPIYLDTEKETVSMRQATTQTFALARKYLAQLADETGGNLVYRARKVNDLNGIYEQVIRDLSTVYSIGYRPGDRARDGSWRGISVQLLAHPDLAARSKRGYYAK